MRPSSLCASPYVESSRAHEPFAGTRRRDLWWDLVALGFLVILSFGLLSREIAFGGSIFDYDILLMSMPAYSWFAEALKQGQFPLWCSALLGGAPIIFAIYTFLYPPDLLLMRVLDGARAFHLSLALHLFLAGCCAYWYCRIVGMRRLPSLLAAVAFQMGNEVLSWQSNGFITRTLFTVPALLAAIELVIRQGGRHWLWIPAIVGAGLAGGYPQTVLYALAISAVYLLVALAANRHALAAKAVLSILLAVGLGVVLGLGLAAVRVMPTLAFTALSTRAGGLDFQRSAVDSVDPWALPIGLLLPAVFEVPGWAAIRPDYMGVGPLLLAGLAVAFPGLLGWRGRFMAALAVVATLLSLGEYTPLYGALLHLPFFSLFRGASRFSPIAAFAIAVLAAQALDSEVASVLAGHRGRYRALAVAAWVGILALVLLVGFSLWLQPGRQLIWADLWRLVVDGGWDRISLFRPRVAVAVVALAASPLLVLACARGRISHVAMEWSFLLITSGSLFTMGWIENPWLPPSALYDPPALLRTLKQDSDLYRVFSWAPGQSSYNVGAFYTGVVGRSPGREFDEHYARQFIPPDLGLLFGVSSIEWYDALQTRRQALVASYVGSERAEPARYADGDSVDWKVHTMSIHDRLNLLAALNVRYITHAFPIQDPRIDVVDEVSVRIYPDLPATAKVYLYRLKTAMPRAFLVPKAVTMRREEDVLEALLAGSVDLHQEVILEQDPLPADQPPLTTGGSSVKVLEYVDGRVTLEASTDGSGYLVLMDFLLPGWSATVDGRPVQILAGNFAGRVVPVEGAGVHRIQFSYTPPLLREGLAVSLASLVALVSAWFAGSVRRRRVPATATP